MATISTQQVLDFVLQQISEDFKLDNDALKNKFSSLDEIYNAIKESTTAKHRNVLTTTTEEPLVTKKKVLRKITKVVVAEPVVVEESLVVAEPVVVEEPVVVAEPVKKKVIRKTTTVADEPVVKKVVRKVTKVLDEPTQVTLEPNEVTVEPNQVTVKPIEVNVKPIEVNVEPIEVNVEPITIPNVVPEEPTPAKKKVIRKLSKTLEEPIVAPNVVVEEPKSNPEHEPVLPAKKKKVIRKNPDVVKEPVEKKLVPTETKKKSKKNVELVEFGTDANSMEGVDEIEANVYVDTVLYNDEDSDSLEPREVNGVKYYIDSSNYVYDFENQDLIGKLNEKGDTIVFLTDFPIEQN